MAYALEIFSHTAVGCRGQEGPKRKWKHSTITIDCFHDFLFYIF